MLSSAAEPALARLWVARLRLAQLGKAIPLHFVRNLSKHQALRVLQGCLIPAVRYKVLGRLIRVP